MFAHLLEGFAVALSPVNLWYAFLGAFVGSMVGVLPGLGATAAMSILLPLTFAAPPTAGVIMLAGIWYGTNYGGSTTSILLKLPGEASSVVTTYDGYKMALKGRAGAALAIAALASFVAGTVGQVGLTVFAPPLARAAVAFGPPEYFAVGLLGLILLSHLSGKVPLKSFIMAAAGVLLGTVGMDPLSGAGRFVLGTDQLYLGFDVVPVIIGMFGLAEILGMAEGYVRPLVQARLSMRELMPTGEEARRSVAPMLRGSIIGFLVGLIPCPAAVLASYTSYGVEKRVSRHRHELGEGAVEGLAGPEAANNSACAGGLVPLLALGLPFAPPTAVLLGAFEAHGINAGPLMMSQYPELFWGVVASMYIGNFMLLVLNLPLIRLFTALLRVPVQILMPAVLVLCLAGSYSVRSSMLDVWVMVLAGFVGFVLRRLDFDPAPLVLGLVLGPTLEKGLRQSLVLFHGDPTGFLARPISGTLLAIALVSLLLVPAIRRFSQRRLAAVAERGS